MPSVITEKSAKLRAKRTRHMKKADKLWRRIAKLEKLGAYRADLAPCRRRCH